MQPRTLLLLTQENEAYEALLHAADLPHLNVVRGDDPLQAQRLIATSQIVLADPAKVKPLLPLANQLQWLQSTFAGVDTLMDKDSRRDYLLTNVRGIFGPLMSEYLFAHLLSLTRHLPRYRQQQQQRLWQRHPYQGLTGRTMLIVGTGSIGQHIANTANCFGMKVYGISRSGAAKAGFEKVSKLCALTTMLPLADVIVSVLPATPQTTHIFNQHSLAYCKPQAILFNVGRGSVIDTDALCAALHEGTLAAAVLDVFEQEPLAEDNPLWLQPNLTITPHNSAYSFPEDVTQIFIDNYQRFIASHALAHQVDFAQGY